MCCFLFLEVNSYQRQRLSASSLAWPLPLWSSSSSASGESVAVASWPAAGQGAPGSYIVLTNGVHQVGDIYPDTHTLNTINFGLSH